MAIWQFEYMIIPKGRQLQDYTKEQIISWKNVEILKDSIIKLSQILSRKESWSSEIHQYGDKNSSCMKLIYEDNCLEEIGCRFDLRDLTKGMLILVIEWINEIRGEILYEDYIYQADIDTLVVLMKNSRAAKFCGDPQDYIKQISGETDI